MKSKIVWQESRAGWGYVVPVWKRTLKAQMNIQTETGLCKRSWILATQWNDQEACRYFRYQRASGTYAARMKISPREGVRKERKWFTARQPLNLDLRCIAGDGN